MAQILSLSEAIQRFVHDGETVALEGFTHLIPTAAAHELIRQNRRDLTLGWQSRGRLPAPAARCGGKGLAA